jgi:hypothetical protein
MALDPNEISREGWANAPDELPSGLAAPEGVAPGPNYYAYFRVYRDGHAEVQWFKRNSGAGGADPVMATTGGTVPAIKQKWDQDTVKAQPDTVSAPPTQPSIVSRDPTTGALTTAPNPNYQAPATATSPAAPPTEKDQGGRHYVWQPNPGGPTAGGRWVDTGPAPLTPAEQQAQQAQQPTIIRAPDKEHPGLTVVATTNPQTGLKETHFEDASGKTVPAPPDAPSYSAKPDTINGKQYTTIVKTPKDGSPPQLSFYGPDGQPIKELPAEVKPGTIIRGQNGQPDQQAVVDPTTGEISYRPIPGAKGSNVQVPADAPQIDLSSPDTAFTSFTRLFQYVDQQVRSGAWTPEQGTSVLAGPHEAVSMTLNREQQQQAQASTLRNASLAQNRDLETQRSSRATEAGNMFARAASAAGAPGAVRGDLTPGYMALQARVADATGANRLPPPIDIPAIGLGRPAPPSAVSSLPAAVPGSQEAAASIEAERQRQIAVNPVFRPAPPTNVQPSGPSTGPTGTLPRPEGPDIPPAATPINPPAGTPGNDPTAPVGMAPDYGVPAVASYQGPVNIDQRTQQLLDAGYSPAEVAEARRRVLARMGAVA